MDRAGQGGGWCLSGKPALVFGCIRHSISGGPLRRETVSGVYLRAGLTGGRLHVSIPAPGGVIAASGSPTELHRAGREAAYRRLALTILGLDVPTLVQTLPVMRERRFGRG
jgi:hypothetical protein